jgi:hypothetical protein
LLIVKGSAVIENDSDTAKTQTCYAPGAWLCPLIPRISLSCQSHATEI